MASKGSSYESILIYWHKLKNLYGFTCLVATIALQIYCLFHYLSDQDVSMVNYTKFHSSMDAIYPSFSFCIRNPIIQENFDQYEETINMSSYVHFLRGKLWDDNLLKVIMIMSQYPSRKI